MNLHDRFHMAFFACFTKTECSASFLNQANHETEVRTITRHYCIIYEFKQEQTSSYQLMRIDREILLPRDVPQPRSMMGPSLLGSPEGHIAFQVNLQLLLSQPASIISPHYKLVVLI